MSRLLRATSITGRPIVTLAGDSPFEVKDVVLGRSRGRLLGFTLRKRGFFSGPVDQTLPWKSVHGLGPDAVMVESNDAFSHSGGLGVADDDDGAGDVLGGQVVTESGVELGEIIEVVIQTGAPPTIVGLEVEASAALHPDGAHLFVPLLEELAVSADRAVVPDSAQDHVRDDLEDFRDALSEFRADHAKES